MVPIERQLKNFVQRLLAQAPEKWIAHALGEVGTQSQVEPQQAQIEKSHSADERPHRYAGRVCRSAQNPDEGISADNQKNLAKKDAGNVCGAGTMKRRKQRPEFTGHGFLREERNRLKRRGSLAAPD